MYCRVVFSFARVADPLTIQTKKNQPFELELRAADLDASQELEEVDFFSILALRRHGQQCTLDTDACDYRIRRVFLQNHRKEVSFLSGIRAEVYPKRRTASPPQKIIFRCSVQHLYTTFVSKCGHLSTPYGPPRVQMDSQSSGLIRKAHAMAAAASEM